MLSAAQKEHKSNAYLAPNPRGIVPTLTHSDLTFGPSIAILAWLDRKHPSRLLFGDTPQESETILQLMTEIFDYLPGATSGVLSPIFFEGVTEAISDLKAAVGILRSELTLHSSILSDHSFLLGSRLDAADAVAFPRI